MTCSPLVSVIVPVYKVEKYLRRCLDSIIGQTLKEIQIICVDDGSPDNCPRILDEYAARDTRIKVIHKTNGGLSSARNAALEVAEAPYIGFVDSDDWVQPETFERALKIMLDDNEIDFVQWNILVHDEETGGLDLDKTRIDNVITSIYPGKQLMTEEVKKHTAYPVWRKLFKAEMLRAHRIIFPDGLLYEDASFAWQVFAYSRYGYFLDEPFSNYSLRPGSIIWRTERKMGMSSLDFLKVIEHVFDFYRRNGIYSENIGLMTYFFKQFALMGYGYTDKPRKYRAMALGLVKRYNLPKNELNELIKTLSKPLDYRRPKFTVLEKIFSIKNLENRKMIRLFGLAISFKRKKRSSGENL